MKDSFPFTLNLSCSDHSLASLTEARDRWVFISQQLCEASHEQSLYERLVQVTYQVIPADRVVLYRFQGSGEGEVVAEVCKRDWTPMLHAVLPALCFGIEPETSYQAPIEINLADKTQSEALTPYQKQLLEHYQVQRSLAFPIADQHQSWGFLVLQHCSPTLDGEVPDLVSLEQLTREFRVRLQALALQSQAQRQVFYLQSASQITTRLLEQVQQPGQIQTALTTALHELRQFLVVDRIAIYQFHEKGRGEFISESALLELSGWVGLDLPKQWQFYYQEQAQTWQPQQAIPLVQTTAALQISHPGYASVLQQFQVQSTVLVPLFINGQPWGLLGIYQGTRIKTWTDIELDCLSSISIQVGLFLQQAEAIQSMRNKNRQLEETVAQDMSLMRIVDRLHKPQKLETTFKVITQDIRQLLGVDRVIIYQFNGDGSGQFVAESVVPGWNPILGTQWDVASASCQQMIQIKADAATRLASDQRRQLLTQPYELCVEDIQLHDFSPEYLDLMEILGTRSYLLTPLYVGHRLWGLLGAYHNQNSHIWQVSERKMMYQLGTQLGIAIQQVEYTEQLTQSAEYEKALSRIFSKIRRSLDVSTVFSTTTQEVRQLLNADRVAVYRFNPDWSGTFVAESVLPGWQPILGRDFPAALSNCPNLTHLRIEGENLEVAPSANSHKLRRGFCVDDIYNMDFSSTYVEAIESLDARAYLITALFFGNKLWGLLAVYQNANSRDWSIQETQLLDKIGAQFSTALQQAVALEKVQAQSQLLTESAEREKRAKEALQQHAIQVLMAVRPTLEGDLTARAPVTEDEIGTIADAYNNTLQSLRRIVMHVQQSTATLAITSSQSEQAIAELAQQAQSQFQVLLKTLDQIQNMADTTQSVTRNAIQVEQAVQRANETVQVGDRAMNRTVDGIMGIRETVAETGKKIKRLSESSQKISRVVNVISNFTSQTQLLALNASIEATRAGEYGRGFSVVADEVRSLARQSAAATTEIEKLVQEIQRETIEVSAAMEQGIEQVVNGTNLVNETRQSLNAIVSSTEEISLLVAGITQAATDQTAQSRSLAETMAELAMTANQTSENAVHISTSFQTLLSMAKNLKTSVDQFKVN